MGWQNNMATSNITKLPLYGDDKYRYQTVLGAKKATMQFWYNSRTEAWYMNVSEQAGDLLVQGLKILPSIVHGGDFSLSHYGLEGYFILVPNTESIKYEDIDPKFIHQYYSFFYVEEV